VQDHRELVILILQKRLEKAKTRLSSVLDDNTREALTLALLRRTLKVCRQVKEATHIMLCAPGSLQYLADQFGAELATGGDEGMRRDICACAHQVWSQYQAALLIVSSDLPLMQVEDIEQITAAWRGGAEVVIAPDRRQRGTNVMLVNNPEHFEYAFGEVLGPGSFHTHKRRAQELGLTVTIIYNPHLALDLDLPADLAAFFREAPDDPLAQFCRSRADDVFRFE